MMERVGMILVVALVWVVASCPGRGVAPSSVGVDRRLRVGSGHPRWVSVAARVRGGASEEDGNKEKKKKKKKRKTVAEEPEGSVAEAEEEEVVGFSAAVGKKRSFELEETAGVFEFEVAVVASLEGAVVGLPREEMEEAMLGEGDAVRVHGGRRRRTIARVTESAEAGISEVVAGNLNVPQRGRVLIAGPLSSVEEARSVEVSRAFEDDELDEDAAFEDEIKPRLAGGRVVKEGDYLDAAKRWVVTAIDGGALEEAATSRETEVSVSSEAAPVEEEETRPTYEDVGGAASHIELLREVLELPLHSPQVFTSLGVPPPKGALVVGPSGCGKTLLSKAAAFESGAHVELVSGSEVMAKKPGEAEEALRAKFAAAEARAPAVVVVDDVDVVGKKRDKATSEHEKRVTSQLLTLMDGLRPASGVVVLAATSRPNDLDPALRRFGRLDREIELAVPDEAARLDILRVKTRRMALADDVDLKAIADDCHGFVGADLAQLCTEAALACVADAVAARRA
eukprot:CAMPEP_0197388872 /NCGR_PEP_ID=MMETSP1165-20131217/1303_1 /TAXON_ID=284809 /ORGANISM="Chrysocystis fragilis, Strain CCMP3189" /LENGTH=510 /DNA_ID=CAMNT_0042914225 /DNA_START=60 /DNA_END=1588 /DNA_ORIENTATION=-